VTTDATGADLRRSRLPHDGHTEEDDVSTYLINHLRIPGLPKPDNLEYLEKV
jgi:hypothetical protein